MIESTLALAPLLSAWGLGRVLCFQHFTRPFIGKIGCNLQCDYIMHYRLGEYRLSPELLAFSR